MLYPIMQDKTDADRISLDQLLTPRQIQCLVDIANGMSTRQIAQHWGVSTKTVETHRASLMKRTGIRNIAGLVRFAIRNGLIEA